MDSSLYRDVVTTRGIKYNVYYSRGTDVSKPTLLFCHGFPSSSYDWRHQVAFFQPLGYGIVVPDMLGYGGTDKPTDAMLYGGTLIAQDMLDVLESVEPGTNVIAIGHDWGSKIVSRLANLDADRILGYVGIAAAYLPPNTTVSYSEFLKATSQITGYELFGYWRFFAEDGADKIILDNFEPFMKTLMALSKDDAVDHFVKTGTLKAWLLAGNPSPPLVDYLTQEEYDTQKETFRKSGVAAPLCWYTTVATSIDLEDSKRIPLEKYTIQKPYFFAAANDDPVVVPALGKASVEKLCTNATIKYYDAGHWVIWTSPARDNLHTDLNKWITDISLKSQ